MVTRIRSITAHALVSVHGLVNAHLIPLWRLHVLPVLLFILSLDPSEKSGDRPLRKKN